MVYVDDPVLLLDEARPVARVEHRCGECRRTITPGERYLRHKFVWEGDLHTYKRCAHCDAFLLLADDLLRDRPRDESGFVHESMFDLDPCMGTIGELIEYDVDRERVMALRTLALDGWPDTDPEQIADMLDDATYQPLDGADTAGGGE